MELPVVDVGNDPLIPLLDAAKFLPKATTTTTHPQGIPYRLRKKRKILCRRTLEQYTLHGVNGVKLCTVRVGNRVYTTRGWINQFVAALNPHVQAATIASEPKLET
jgi:hypothetical protein